MIILVKYQSILTKFEKGAWGREGERKEGGSWVGRNKDPSQWAQRRGKLKRDRDKGR